MSALTATSPAAAATAATVKFPSEQVIFAYIEGHPLRLTQCIRCTSEVVAKFFANKEMAPGDIETNVGRAIMTESSKKDVGTFEAFKEAIAQVEFLQNDLDLQRSIMLAGLEHKMYAKALEDCLAGRRFQIINGNYKPIE